MPLVPGASPAAGCNSHLASGLLLFCSLALFTFARLASQSRKIRADPSGKHEHQPAQEPKSPEQPAKYQSAAVWINVHVATPYLSNTSLRGARRACACSAGHKGIPHYYPQLLHLHAPSRPSAVILPLSPIPSARRPNQTLIIAEHPPARRQTAHASRSRWRGTARQTIRPHRPASPLWNQGSRWAPWAGSCSPPGVDPQW